MLNEEQIAVKLAQALTQQVNEHEPIKIAGAVFPSGAIGVMGLPVPNCIVVGVEFAPGVPLYVTVMN